MTILSGIGDIQLDQKDPAVKFSRGLMQREADSTLAGRVRIVSPTKTRKTATCLTFQQPKESSKLGPEASALPSLNILA